MGAVVVQIVQRQAKTMSDKLAQLGVRTLRTSFDLLTGYRHKTLTPDKASLSLEEMRKQGYAMTPQQWLLRFLFLETVAGVPGMVAGTCRCNPVIQINRAQLTAGVVDAQYVTCGVFVL